MKRILAIFKDLQDSGQDAVILGQFSIQVGNSQDVANINNVREQSKIALPEPDKDKNPNRYITERDRDDVHVRYPVSSVAFLPDLVEVIASWSNLPDAAKAGIMAMVDTVSTK